MIGPGRSAKDSLKGFLEFHHAVAAAGVLLLAALCYGQPVHAAGSTVATAPAPRAAQPVVTTPRAATQRNVVPPPVDASAAGQVPSQVPNQAAPKVYLFRGALGPLFSTGMDRLAEKIERAGFRARVFEFTLCDLIELQVAKAYREEPGPIVLIGHSMGGLCGVRMAIALQEEHIPVSLIVTIDPAHATKSVPLNVERFINLFLSDNILGGGDVKPEPGYRGHYASFDMKDHDEVTHINIDKMNDVHAQLVDMISRLSQTPATMDPDPVPLRYLVPPQASVELWDSGVAMFVRPGDTLEQIAANYGVPLWALQQANKGADSAALIPGERIVIPRHLMPLAATAAAVNTPVVTAPPPTNTPQVSTRR